METKNCIICNKLAIYFIGIVRRGRDNVKAGLCDEHKEIKPANWKGIPMCHGLYNKRMDESSTQDNIIIENI